MAVDLSEIWHLYPKQARFVGNDSLFNLFLGGVGSGKSVALTAWVIRRALKNPESTGALLGRTSVDLQSVLLPSLFEQLQAIQDASGACIVRDYDKGNAVLTLSNDSRIYFRPYNRISKLRGLTLTFAAADEVEFSEADSDEIWSVLSGRLRGKGTCPGLCFATSPNGMRGITKRFVDAQLRYDDAMGRGDIATAREASQYHTVTATSMDNPFLPPHFFNSLTSMSQRRYSQEVLGKVLKPLNSVFEIGPQHVIDYDWREQVNRARVSVYAVDWGSQGHHVAMHIQIEPGTGRWIVCRELIDDVSPRGKFLDRLIQWIEEGVSLSGVQPALIGVDRACPIENGGLSRKFSRTSVLGMHSRDEQKIAGGLEMMRDMLDPVSGQPELVFAKSLSHVVSGATAGILPALRGGYRYAVDSMGQPTQRPLKDNIHDHAIDALRYAIAASASRPDLHGGRMLSMPNTGTAAGPGRSGSKVGT